MSLCATTMGCFHEVFSFNTKFCGDPKTVPQYVTLVVVRNFALMGGHFPTILGSFWGHWDLAIKWVLSDRSIDLRL